jgi:hypothetical protein
MTQTFLSEVGGKIEPYTYYSNHDTTGHVVNNRSLYTRPCLNNDNLKTLGHQCERPLTRMQPTIERALLLTAMLLYRSRARTP